MPTDMITARDEISSAAIKAVLIDFWEYAHENIESVNFNLRLVKAKDRFIDVAQKEATNPYCIVYQKYRLKICIRIDYKSHLEFYIRYRDLGDEQIIDGIPEMISNSVRYIQNYGPQMSLREDHYDYAWTYPENYTE